MRKLLRTVLPLVLIFTLLASTALVSADDDHSKLTSQGSGAPVDPPITLLAEDDILFEQTPVDIGGMWTAYSSATNVGYLCQEDFSGVTADIGDIHWYGVDLNFDSFTPGDPSGMQFQIVFYEDNAGSPGTQVAQFSDVTPAYTVYVDTGWVGYVYRFDFDLPSPVSLGAGWVSIQSTSSTDGGSFLWLSSPDGNFNALQNGGSTGDNLAFALTERSSDTVLPSMAAPNIAEIILEAEEVDPQQSIGKGKNRTFINLIQLTAAHMGPQTDFDGVSKYLLLGEPGEEVETLNPAYWQAVLDFLNGQIAFYGLSIGPLSYSYADYVADQNGGTEPGIIFAEDFTSVFTGEIPAGWSQTAAYPNWSVYTASNYAGGTIPEMIFRWTPSFVGTSRLITPAIDAGAYSNLELTFKQMVDNFDSYNYPYVLKVQVSLDDGSNWTDAWSLAPWGDVPAQTVTVDLSAYAGQSFKLAWVFSGNSYGIDWWYIDDILVTGS